MTVLFFAKTDGVKHQQNIKRISTRAKRIYRRTADIRPVRNGFGVSVISTNQGLLTDREARKQKLGGEVLFEIW